jgi:hypothetical protein
MFCELKVISKKSGKGTVSGLYRQVEVDRLKFTGVIVATAECNNRMGKVKPSEDGQSELNAWIQVVVAYLEAAIRNVWGSYRRGTKTLLGREDAVRKRARGTGKGQRAQAITLSC